MPSASRRRSWMQVARLNAPAPRSWCHRRPRHCRRDRRASGSAAHADRDRHRRAPRRPRTRRRGAAGTRRPAGAASGRRDDPCRAQLFRPQRGRHGAHRRGGACRRGACRRAPARRRASVRRSSRSAARPPRCMRGTLAGVTELRAGVYMFGDLFQAGIGTHDARRHRGDGAGKRDRAAARRAPLPGRCRRPGAVEGPQHRGVARTIAVLVWCWTRPAGRSFGDAIVERAYQEHGVVACDPALPWPDLRGRRAGARSPPTTPA